MHNSDGRSKRLVVIWILYSWGKAVVFVKCL